MRTLTETSSSGNARTSVAASSRFFESALRPNGLDEVLAQRPERVEALVAVEHLCRSKDDRGPVVHARVEQRVGIDQPVDMGDRNGDRSTTGGGPKGAGSRPAVQEQPVTVAGVSDRKDHRSAVKAQSDVATSPVSRISSSIARSRTWRSRSRCTFVRSVMGSSSVS